MKTDDFFEALKRELPSCSVGIQVPAEFYEAWKPDSNEHCTEERMRRLVREHFTGLDIVTEGIASMSGTGVSPGSFVVGFRSQHFISVTTNQSDRAVLDNLSAVVAICYRGHAATPEEATKYVSFLKAYFSEPNDITFK